MRIGIDAHMLGDHSGGNESFYSNILSEMIPDNDMEIFLFVSKGYQNEKLAKKFTVIELKRINALERYMVELPLLCKRLKLDILHTQYFIPLKSVCPTVCTIHDICFEHFKNIFTKREYFLQKTLIPYATKHSKRIITVSNYSKKDLIDKYHIKDKNILIAYNSINKNYRVLSDTELFEKQIREKYEIGDSKVVLSVGNLQPRKNLPRLIRSFIMAKEDLNNDVKLVIVGKKAWMYEKILEDAKAYGNDIIFTDYVSEEDLIKLYNIAECFVYPSLFEGFGIPPLEAMACGTPVAVSNTTSLPEVVGDAGFYFDPLDENSIKKAIIAMLREDYLSENLKQKMEKQVQRFSWKNSADIIVDCYREVKKNG